MPLPRAVKALKYNLELIFYGDRLIKLLARKGAKGGWKFVLVTDVAIGSCVITC